MWLLSIPCVEDSDSDGRDGVVGSNKFGVENNGETVVFAVTEDSNNDGDDNTDHENVVSAAVISLDEDDDDAKDGDNKNG